MSDEYCLPGLLGAEELRTAIKALGLDPGTERLTTVQLKSWGLVRNTWTGNLWASHHGSAEEQFGGGDDRPVVQTKRTIARWREK